MSNAINEIDNTDLVFVFGYNPADSHPIVANHVINAKRNGAKIIVCDPRKIETARIADMHIALKNGSNIALLNAMGHVIIEENLYDKAFVASRTEGFEEYRKIVEGYTPESVEDITGVSASEIRQAARMYAQAKSAAILWGMGVTQFYQGVETVRSLTSLAMLTGNLGKPHAGVNPVRGQNNVQGACDMGALPDTYPGYQYVKDPANREKFAKAWGVESLPAHTGYRISELPHRAAHGEVRAAYIMGEDPLQTDAELSAVRKAFEDLELVIVQDIFMTKTASAADVILPSTSWVTNPVSLDYPQAKVLAEKAAQAGSKEGEVTLAHILVNTQAGKPDYPKAISLLENASEDLENDSAVDAQMLLGLIYANGVGIKADDDKATWYFKRSSAISRTGYSEYWAGMMFLNGEEGFIEKNKQKALHWLNLSCMEGFDTGCEEFEKLTNG